MNRYARSIAATLSCIGVIAVTACSSSSGSGSGSGPITFGIFNPFSGADAALGPEMLTTCNAATHLINNAGGVLGHKARCLAVDTRGDPADAVPAAQQMLASTSNLGGILGPSSDEATATEPVFNHAHIPMFADSGQAAFDHTTDQYFWRVSPADDIKGYAMAAWAHHQGYTRAAAVFGDDVASQSNVPTLSAAFRALGGTFVSNLRIPLDQSSYRTEVEQLLASHPQVIFTETDGQTAATFFSELQQLNGGNLLPIIGTEITIEASYQQAVAHAISNSQLRRNLVGLQQYAPTSGGPWQTFANAMATTHTVGKSTVAVYDTDPYATGYYDSINLMALAMLQAKSIDPAVYNPYILKISQAGPGKTVVSAYAAGKKAISAGKPVQYLGASGPTTFNRWHNSSGAFEVAGFVSLGKLRVVGTVSAAQIAQLTSRASR